MANVLTPEEAANVLRCESDDALMLDLLPSIDSTLQLATGRDWAADIPVREAAKSAARILLVRWHEDPGSIGDVLGPGLRAAMLQLKALALELASAGVPDEALALVRSQPADGATGVAVGASLVLIFNHKMAASAPSAVSMETAAGAAVTLTASLDATGKILTVQPAASLSAGTGYVLTIDAAPDVFGQTLSRELAFTTA